MLHVCIFMWTRQCFPLWGEYPIGGLAEPSERDTSPQYTEAYIWDDLTLNIVECDFAYARGLGCLVVVLEVVVVGCAVCLCV